MVREIVSAVFETAVRALNVTAAGAAITTVGLVSYEDPAVEILIDAILPVAPACALATPDAPVS